jgi:subtilisin family serine protease
MSLVACLAVVTATAATVSGASAASSSGTTSTYLVVFKAANSPANAVATVRGAGGTVVANYSQIGVVVARSSNASFRANLAKAGSIDGVSSTAGFATKLDADASGGSNGPPPGGFPNSPATDNDTFSPLQWDMAQIHTPQAHAITGGSPSVLVGDIDTGIDFANPDLQPNIDTADSANCLSGTPVAGTAAQDDNGHGTHTAGTIAAASNGLGIVGVAPNVRIAGIKAGNSDGFFFPEAVVCAFMWAGTHGVAVTNNSYFADPFLFNCKNDPEQKAIWTAEQRAIMFAEQQGVTVVAAAGNEFEDISHPSRDQTSPDNQPIPQDRRVTNACAIVPVEVPGVVGVSATGNDVQDTSAGQYPDNLKSFYSSFGINGVDVAAPGGDSIYGITASSFNGRVLSDWPASVAANCLPSRQVTDPGHPGLLWCYQQGTSMASPHVTGVAALVISRYGPMSVGKVRSILEQTADPQACPNTLPAGPPPYTSFVGLNDEKVQTCQGGPGHNSWYGSGQVDALNAITHAVGNG